MDVLSKVKKLFYRRKVTRDGRIKTRILFLRFNSVVKTSRAADWRDLYDKTAALYEAAPYVSQSSHNMGSRVWQFINVESYEKNKMLRMSVDSVRMSMPGFTHVLLTEENLNQYISTMPDYILAKHAKGEISDSHYREIIKLFILAEYGGYWLDESLYMSSCIPEHIEKSSFFVFKSEPWYFLDSIPKGSEQLEMQLRDVDNPYHCVLGEMIYAKPGNHLVCKVLGMLLSYWKDHNKHLYPSEYEDYFVSHLFTRAILTDAKCRKVFESSPKVHPSSLYRLRDNFDEIKDDNALASVTSETFVHKLEVIDDNHFMASVESHFVLQAITRRWHDGYPLASNFAENMRLPLDEEAIYRRQTLNQEAASRLRKRIRDGKKVRVVFLVAMMSMFPARRLFEVMRNDKRFDPSILIIPERRFGSERMLQHYEECKRELSCYSSHVSCAPLNQYEDEIRLMDIADIVVPSVPYEDVSTLWYKPHILFRQNLLLVLVNYAFYRGVSYCRKLITWSCYQQYWKVFIETEYNRDEYVRHTLMKGKNTLLSGYCKMDAFAPYLSRKQQSKSKTVLICPHHTIQGGLNDMLGLSCFIKFAPLFLRIPKMYPNVHFIFRPHPALFSVLEREKHWGKQRVAEYMIEIKSNANVTWSSKGNYFEDFADSDAIIQDCGSFLVEYMYTGKPQCYMLRNNTDAETRFAPLGQKCLEHSYIATEEEHILEFLDNVVVAGRDVKADARLKFAKKEVMLNFPYASEKALELLWNELEK